MLIVIWFNVWQSFTKPWKLFPKYSAFAKCQSISVSKSHSPYFKFFDASSSFPVLSAWRIKFLVRMLSSSVLSLKWKTGFKSSFFIRLLTFDRFIFEIVHFEIRCVIHFQVNQTLKNYKTFNIFFNCIRNFR